MSALEAMPLSVLSPGATASVVSVGSTPTALHAASLAGVTEVRAGVFVFLDLFQAALCELPVTDIALSTLASVVGARPEDDTVILDARSPEEYSGERVGGPGGPDVGAVRYGRVPGARHIYYLDLMDETRSFRPPAELAAEVTARGVGPDDSIIAYCRMSHRATVLYFALTERLGFRKVRIYDGSWTEWGNLVGYPIER